MRGREKEKNKHRIYVANIDPEYKKNTDNNVPITGFIKNGNYGGYGNGKKAHTTNQAEGEKNFKINIRNIKQNCMYKYNEHMFQFYIRALSTHCCTKCEHGCVVGKKQNEKFNATTGKIE